MVWIPEDVQGVCGLCGEDSEDLREVRLRKPHTRPFIHPDEKCWEKPVSICGGCRKKKRGVFRYNSEGKSGRISKWEEKRQTPRRPMEP